MEKLSGPVSYDHFNFRGKDYLFFGDFHVKKNPCAQTCSVQEGCQDFVTFLKKLAQQMSDDKIYMDVFLESPYGLDYLEPMVPKKLSESIILDAPNIDLLDSYLADTIHDTNIKNCLAFAKRGCVYNPYVRIHYADLRNFFKDGRFLTTPFEDLIKYSSRRSEYARLFFDYGFLREYFNLMFESNEFSKDGINLLSKYPSLVSLNLMDHFEVMNLQMHPIRKQFIKIEGDLGDLVRRFIMIELDMQMNEAKTLLQKDNWQLHTYNKIPIEAVLTWVNTLIMDTYLLLRLFRKFDHPSNMAITYTGIRHSANYSKFFKQYLDAAYFPTQYSNIDTLIKIVKNPGTFPAQCISDMQLNNLINSPRLSNSNLDISGHKIDKQYLYGLVMGGTFVQFVYDKQKYVLDFSNVHQILQVGFDKENYYLENGNYDRIYFSDSDFLEGYTKNVKLYRPIFMTGTYPPKEVEWTQDKSLRIKGSSVEFDLN